MNPRHEIGWGLVWLLGGLAATWYGYTNAANSPMGGTYVVFWGAVAYGGFRLVHGLYRYPTFAAGESAKRPDWRREPGFVSRDAHWSEYVGNIAPVIQAIESGEPEGHFARLLSESERLELDYMIDSRHGSLDANPSSRLRGVALSSYIREAGEFMSMSDSDLARKIESLRMSIAEASLTKHWFDALLARQAIAIAIRNARAGIASPLILPTTVDSAVEYLESRAV